MRAWVLAAALSTLVGPLALPSSAQAQAGSSLEDARDQGILYLRKGLDRQAKARLDEAWRLPGGSKDFRTAFFRAQAAFKLMLLEEAFDTLAVARTLADDQRRKQSLDEFEAEMTLLYGAVSIVPAAEEKKRKGRIFFEAKTGIINKEKKQLFLSIRERFRSSDIDIPAKIYLPYGEYLANGVAFSTAQGESTPTVAVFLQVGEDAGAPSTASASGGSKLWLWVGLGAAAAVAAGVGTYFLLSEGDAPPPESRFAIEF